MKKKLTYEAVIANEVMLEQMYHAYQYTFGDRETLKDQARSYKLTIDDYIKCICFYIRNNIEHSTIANILNDLLLIENKIDVIAYLVAKNYSYQTLSGSIPEYVVKYRPDLLFDKEKLASLRSKIALYMEYKEKLKSMKNSQKNSIPNCREKVIDFINSNHTIRRFCYEKNITLVMFRDCVNEIKNTDPKLYNEFINANQLREVIKNENIQNNIISILNRLKEKGFEIDSIDYFLLTEYSPVEILGESDKILNYEDNKIIHSFVSKYRNIRPYSEHTINNLQKDRLVISVDEILREVSDESKIEILNYLNEHSIPIAPVTYREACIRYYRGTLFDNVKTI